LHKYFGYIYIYIYIYIAPNDGPFGTKCFVITPIYNKNFRCWVDEMDRKSRTDEKNDICSCNTAVYKTSRKIVHTRSVGRWEDIIKMWMCVLCCVGLCMCGFCKVWVWVCVSVGVDVCMCGFVDVCKCM